MRGVRSAREVIRRADIVVEVLDARDPWGTRSRSVEKLAKRLGKRMVFVINKADLAPRDLMERWKRVLEREAPTVYISARERLGTRMLWRVLRREAGGRSVTVAVVGLPNVGKSTVINVLRGRHSAGTSPTPGFTRASQVLRAASWLRVVDTPGIVPRASGVFEKVLRSALRPEALEDPVPVATRLVQTLLAKDPEVFRRTYGVGAQDPHLLLEELARRRGLFLKGGRLNVEEAARIVIRDWQAGRLVVFFTPEDYGLGKRGSGA